MRAFVTSVIASADFPLGYVSFLSVPSALTSFATTDFATTDALYEPRPEISKHSS